MTRTLAIFIVVSALLHLGCSAPAADVAAEEEAIRQTSERWRELEDQRDAAGVAALFEPDGALIWEDQPTASGTAGVEALLAKSYAFDPNQEGSWAPDEILMASSGDLAVELGGYENPGTVGRYATIHRKVDGEWKIHSDFSVDTGPSGGAPSWARELLEAWYETYNGRDAAALAATYSADARVGTDDEGATGRAAIASFFEAQWKDQDLQCTGDFDEFMVVGPLAAGRGRDECTGKGEDGTEVTVRSSWVAFYEQQEDGSWLCVRDNGEPLES